MQMADQREICGLTGLHGRDYAFTVLDAVRAIEIGEPLRKIALGLGGVEGGVKLGREFGSQRAAYRG